jgi:hypothetical protein
VFAVQVHIDLADECIQLASQCRLPYLKKGLQEMPRKADKADSFECTKPGTNTTVLCLESDEATFELQQHLGMLAEQVGRRGTLAHVESGGG